ncbi:MAG: FAD-dependent thymidylate synthase [Candidatus Nanoarchaeia archaeon]|nr:FAD-dependent thymidylate synthase [Candidatus Nanoarchaeia archaeon]MDD4563811.1 FAD-dependent thymidylate synthase [Candidatus Nanoarchaeia archaeon]
MKVQEVGSTNRIKTQKTAKRWVQNHARICYSEKNWDELLNESFMPGLVGSLIGRGHHSPFDHFFLNFYFDGPEKSLAMIFNNQGLYNTSEKSARYTVMRDISREQKRLYDKWSSWFLSEVSQRFPEEKFHTLYNRKRPSEKSLAEKLSQENARYMTSVFTPTKMTHSLTWRQTNIIYHWFTNFIKENENSSDEFKGKLAEAMKGYTESDLIKKWIIDEAQVKMKGNIPLSFFRKPVEEHFGEDIYSTNYLGSFASLAQLQRHRLVNYSISSGFEKGALNGFYVPRLVEASGKTNEWLDDLYFIARTDFPQAQLLNIGERGYRENLSAKVEERECGLAQLETARIVDNLLKSYSNFIPDMSNLRKPACNNGGCEKGGCTFGAKNYLERLI